MTGGRAGPRAGGRAGQLATSGLRPGWTTGACATAAARAAWVALVAGDPPDPVTVELPGDRCPAFALTDYAILPDGTSMAAVTKDAGDDPDVTHGAVVRVRVRHTAPGTGTTFSAGPGVGVVTRPGLPLPVGEPAVNPAPRAMIVANLVAAAVELGWPVDPAGQVDANVEVGVDGGEALAARTLNPRLGIVGGLSILGTTGVVVPYSCSAWIDAIRRGVDVARASGVEHVAACTGSTSEATARRLHGLDDVALIDMGDFAGAVLTYLRRHPVPRLTVCGGFAKVSKLASGHLDLHSARSGVDVGHLAGLAAGSGANPPAVQDIRAATTALDALTRAGAHGVPLGDLVAVAARDQALRVLAGAPVAVDVVCIDRTGQIVGRAPTTTVAGPTTVVGPTPGWR